MAYSLIPHLMFWIEEDRVLELCSNSKEAQITDDDITDMLNKAIEAADSEIDSFCLNRWPALRSEDPVPPEINKMSSHMAIYYLFLRRAGDHEIPEARRVTYEDCIKKLKLFADNKIALGLDTEGNKAAAGEDSFRTDASTDYTIPSDDPRTYTPDVLEKL